MALISPGVEVQVIDESQYTPTAAGTVAYVLVATAEDKQTPGGTLAPYTTKATAGQLQSITSQRDLVQKFGIPTFQVDSSDNPIHGDERNEYGLQAAYSALGVSNRIYVQRADINLAQLQGTGIRPTGTPADGTYWLDLSNTNFGQYEWNPTNTFGIEEPLIITDPADLEDGVPRSSVGAVWQTAVVAISNANPIYYKNEDNDWVLIGSEDWRNSVPTIVGTVTDPDNINGGDNLYINGIEVTLSGNGVVTLADVVDDINQNSDLANVGIRADVYPAVGPGQVLRLFSNSLSVPPDFNNTPPDSPNDFGLKLQKGGTDTDFPESIGDPDFGVKVGLLESTGANVKYIWGPTVQFSSYRNVPAWKSTDDEPRPYTSVWFKTSATGNGANWSIKQYDENLDQWIPQAAPLYSDDTAAIFALDPAGGGGSIGTGSLYVQYDTVGDNTATFKIFRKNSIGLLKITGATPANPLTFTSGHSFILEASVPGSANTVSATIVMPAVSGNVVTAQGFVGSILAANIPNVIAAVEASGAISITHLAGGTIKFTKVAGGDPIVNSGLLADSKIRQLFPENENVYLASPFGQVDYTYSFVAPFSNPADGTLWYYNNPLDVDVMINDGTSWKGYRLVTRDARGYDLRLTDPAGVILSASRPSFQSDGSSQLRPGDLWLDTGDLENYPVIYRYTGANWELIDNTDQVSTDGILFADARWDFNGELDPIVDDLPETTSMLTSNYIDDDCPDYRLYARGTLLFNTRRSGYNVKRFESRWFANPDSFFGDVEPEVISTWVSHSGVDSDGVPYFGHWAQRNTIVEAMKAAIESSTELREENTQFNLIACPGYPELIQNMITLNNDRKQTAFIIGDSPLALNSDNIEPWAKNTGLALDNGPDALVSTSEYLGVYYPAGFSTSLDGESVVVPASHMMLRTFIRSDNVSYPWFAPAGVRRGVIDNASAIGYIDVNDGNIFKSIGVTVGLRDILYDNRVNPLTVLPGVGLVAYGQKTRASQTSAMDRVNVARLIVYLRLVLDKVARPFIFEPNDTITRNQVKAGFESVLNDVVAKRGLYDYLVVCDTTNNTPDRIDRNELYVDIAIKPVKAIEFVYIPVRIRNTGAEL
jgi:hypothetical protein